MLSDKREMVECFQLCTDILACKSTGHISDMAGRTEVPDYH